MEEKKITKRARPRRVKKSAHARAIGPWFKCSCCDSRNIIYSQRRAVYICRRCGEVFTVDWKRRLTISEPDEGGLL